jgi:YegS/Rv2252/BmrU family lipid kinase
MRRAWVVLNPHAGGSDADRLREAVARTAAAGLHCDVHVITPEEPLTATVRAALPSGLDLVAAAGGDGTVSAVASALVHTDVPLGIIPIGTGNILARDLGIPLDLDSALQLLCGPHHTRTLDAMQVADRHFLLSIGVGLSAVMMRDTTPADKRRLGRQAYLLRGLQALLGFQPRRFTLAVDGRVSRVRAAEVVVANSSTAGSANIRWGPHIHLDDGALDVCIVRARVSLDYFKIAWHLLRRQKRDPRLRFLRATDSIVITAGRPLPVEADGDWIGQTPLRIQLVPAAVRVIVP